MIQTNAAHFPLPALALLRLSLIERGFVTDQRPPVSLLSADNPLFRIGLQLKREAYRNRSPAIELPAGITSRIPYEEYREMPGMSMSRLKRMKRSPQHFQHEPGTTPALTLGSAAHCKVLEPDRFDLQYRVWDRRTDAGRAAPRSGKSWDLFEAQCKADDFEILTLGEAYEAAAIARAIRSDKRAMKYLDGGEPEVTMQWQMQGHECKGRPDYLKRIDGQSVLVGLKTTRDCRPRWFGRQAADLDYPMSWAWYFNGYFTLTGERPKVVEIVVENTAPYAVAVYVIPDEVLFKGEEEYGKLLPQYDGCVASGRWPGPVPQETDLEIPSWYYGDDKLGEMSGLGLEFA